MALLLQPVSRRAVVASAVVARTAALRGRVVRIAVSLFRVGHEVPGWGVGSAWGSGLAAWGSAVASESAYAWGAGSARVRRVVRAVRAVQAVLRVVDRAVFPAAIRR
ncbi:hypothetical protein GCM10010193_58380 [Kitasatospora atroaurantiaca]